MNLLAEGAFDGLWMLGVFLAGATLVIYLLRRQAARAKTSSPAPRASSSASDLHRSMDRLLVELQETSREINATIDTKMIVLNKLIEDTDRKIAELKALQPSREKAPAPAPAARPAPPEQPLGEEARKRRELEREICRLADDGKTELEIARRTNTPRGEVELVLRLREQPGTGDMTR
jgi:hypothetical protein